MSRPIAVVTGGAGFIGSHMVDLLLSSGYQVRVLDNFTGGHERNLEQHSKNFALHIEKADICELDPRNKLFDNAKYVFHFAGIGDIVPSIEKPIDYMNTNVQGTVRVLEAARSAGVEKFVYAASSSCYGLAETPTNEDHPISPQYPYALSKYQGEQAAFHWHQVYGLPVNSLRIFNAYGTRVRTTGVYGAVFGVFLAQKLNGKPFTVVGDGTQTRDFTYVTDVADAFISAAESNHSGEVFNVGSGNHYSVNELVSLLGGDVVSIPKRPGEPDCTFADVNKINRMLGWKAKVTLENGVRQMLDRLEDWRDAPVWNPDSIQQATSKWFKYLGDKVVNV